jgi:exopolyphosphatase/guanosine-5'-triphosphate,3'-diphosphate pyrophosphatase
MGSRPVAVIDIGSNSVFLMVLALDSNYRPVLLERIKDNARLGAALDRNGCLPEATIDRLVATMRRFRAAAERHDAEVYGVATAAIRRAHNGDKAMDRLAREAGVNIEVISGEKEAEMAYLGVLFGRVVGLERVLCADVGGGSTEIVVGHAGQVLALDSVPVGAVVLTAETLGTAPVSSARVETARQLLVDWFADVKSRLSDQHWQSAVATSGSIQRIARMVLAAGGVAPNSDIDGMTVTQEDLAELIAKLGSASSLEAIRTLPGIDLERADILLAGALIYHELGRSLAIDRWTVSLAGLRMGLFAYRLHCRGELQLA